MPNEQADEYFNINTVKVGGKVFLNADDVLAWLKDCQQNGMDNETIQWLIKSLVICKNSVKHKFKKS